MKVLNNYLENDIVNKGLLLKTSDLILTPCRKVFNGKNIELISDREGVISIKESLDTTSKLQKVLWATLAVITIPLAAIAACFKLIISPSIGRRDKPFEIGNCNQLLNNLEEVVDRLKPLKEAGLKGGLNVYLALTPEQQQLTLSEAARSIQQHIERMKITDIAFIETHQLNNQNEPGKIDRFAILTCKIRRA